MERVLVMTCSWWLDAAPAAVWPLLADAEHWPRWWRTVQAVTLLAPVPDAAAACAAAGAEGPGGLGAAPRADARPPRWRPCWPGSGLGGLGGLRGRGGLRLRLQPRACEPPQLIEWQVSGDLRATWTWVLGEASPSGSELTCRCALRWPPEPAGRPGLPGSAEPSGHSGHPGPAGWSGAPGPAAPAAGTPAAAAWTLPALRWLLARGQIRRMRHCARDMGRALGCRSGVLRAWSGWSPRRA